MEIFLKFNEGKDYQEHGFYEFKILSCCAPSNLWLILDRGINDADGLATHDFQYWKIVSLMEVSTRLQAGIELHGKVVTIALGNYGHLYNMVLDFEGDSANWSWEQYDNPINNAGSALDIHLIDLDELHQSKKYLGLSLEDCIKKLLLEDGNGYESQTLRCIDKDGNILNMLERDDLQYKL